MPHKGKRMKKQRICMILALMAFGLIIVPLTSAIADESLEERYTFGIKPSAMPEVSFTDGDTLHDFHVEKIEAAGKDCTVCHFDDDYENFMNLGNMTGDSSTKRTAYVHTSCVSCHATNGGPEIAACRTCHVDNNAQ